MSEPIVQLSDGELRELAAALRAGRLAPPYSSVTVGRFVTGETAERISTELQQFSGQGFSAQQLAMVLETLGLDRAQRSRADDAIDLVVTGPESPGIANRDTSVVVRELFAGAEASVLVAGYAVYQGQQVFRALADRMAARVDLKVRMFLDIQRGQGDTAIDGDLVRRFVDRFKTKQWPAASRLPQLFYDPRSIDLSAEQRACLHAKCIVVDGRYVFISSANFTEAAQQRNIEVGLLVRSSSLAEQLANHFDSLVTLKILRKAL